MNNLTQTLHSIFTGALELGMLRRVNTVYAFGPSGARASRLASMTPDIVKTTAGASTITTAEMKAFIYKRDCNGADRSDTTPTAALMVAAMPKVGVDVQYEWSVYNNGSANTLTLLAGSGVTLVGTITVAFGNIRRFRIKFTNVTPGSEAVEIMNQGVAAV